ncbi:Chitinase class I [Paragonimus heterotremus]|uniref:Chitinase class I n=1 Tax=Paragonimus heterotremus TaxID=100268 RepID=A0A8J4TNJ8_9TREM|nr:Chitinase class I [Paragonimus heterotremus]
MITSQEWEELFPERWGVGQRWRMEYYNTPFYNPSMETDYYSYDNFARAVCRARELGLDRFLDEPATTPEERLRERVGFLATIAHQTSNGVDGLYYREMLSHERYVCGKIDLFHNVRHRFDFITSSRPSYYPEACHNAGELKFPQQSYHGRGAIQLTGAYNYGLFSEFVFGNPEKLLQNPDLLLTDGCLGFLSAIWYWMTEMGKRPSAHRAMYRHMKHTAIWGFGHTIVHVTDGAEADGCEGGPTDKDRSVTARVCLYRAYAQRFGIRIGLNGEQLDTRGLS